MEERTSPFRFENFEIWQRGRKLVKDVYCLTKKFPTEEKYSLTDQLRRAVISVPSNIAEGSARKTKADFIHFLLIARASLAEAFTQCILAEDLDYFVFPNELRVDIETLAAKINALIASLSR